MKKPMMFGVLGVLGVLMMATAAAFAQQPSQTFIPAPTAAPAPAPPPQQKVIPAPPRCGDCGTVQSVRLVEEKGGSSGGGAVLGAIVGGVIGHQIGSGRGNTVATIAGAGGGALAGNEIERNRNSKSYWEVGLRMDGGAQRTFHYSSQPYARVGERVRLIDGGRSLEVIRR